MISEVSKIVSVHTITLFNSTKNRNCRRLKISPFYSPTFHVNHSRSRTMTVHRPKGATIMDEGGGDDLEMVNLESGKVAESPPKDVPASPEEKLDPVPFKTLFRFASTGDVTLMSIGIFGTFLAGATLPGINVVFGEVTDAISSPANISELVGVACRNMGILAVFGFASFFVAYYCVAKAAARIANGWRVVYLDAVLRQDAAFFDSQEQGSISMTLADGALDIQNGLSDKMAAAMQGIFQVRPSDIHIHTRPVIERRTQSQWQRNSPLPPPSPAHCWICHRFLVWPSPVPGGARRLSPPRRHHLLAHHVRFRGWDIWQGSLRERRQYRL